MAGLGLAVPPSFRNVYGGFVVIILHILCISRDLKDLGMDKGPATVQLW